jgi:uncharacterized repeat protein (TIGR03837 family)
MNAKKLTSCDVFCAVVDNYGDIGVCWRLAKQLSSENKLTVRLWVDDLDSFSRFCPEVVATLPIQKVRGIEIRHWSVTFAEVIPAQIVIEAFACELPESYVLALTHCIPKPVWLNLEYLSAEDWVAGCHGLPSPHSKLPLVKYFFFPGFTGQTGGLIIEQDLLERRDKFREDVADQAKFWQSINVPFPLPGEVRVSLFSYENSVVNSLLSIWAEGSRLLTCLIPEGRVLPQVADFFSLQELKRGDVVQKGNLRVYVLPFVEQEEYDKLLWSCDINFVRGEDSCVRAQWAGKPFVWHIYPQHDGVHMNKLHAFLRLYGKELMPRSLQVMAALWEEWNAGELAAQADYAGLEQIWNDFLSQQSTICRHANAWAKLISGNNLALNLLDFSLKVGRIAPF